MAPSTPSPPSPPGKTGISIELAPRPTVQGLAARYQSLWLLLRLYYATRTGQENLPVAHIQARFPGQKNLRMMISRAFADFGKWDIEVGWGWDQSCAHAALALKNRSRGPFWMPEPQAARLSITDNGQPVALDALAAFLGVDSQARRDAGALDYAMQDVEFWNRLTLAMRAAKDGMGSSDLAGVAGHFHAAHAAAQDNFQAALSVLNESLAWRRQGQVRRSWEALESLTPYLLDEDDDYGSQAAFSAMAAIARAWNRYSAEGARAAQAELTSLQADPRLRPVVQHNPRVRFEFLNLRALLFKSSALKPDDLPLQERRDLAVQSIKCFSKALQAAYEAGAIESAQEVAANIGLSLWLFWKDALLDTRIHQDTLAVQIQALRWICLSEWICDRFGVGGGSVWNIVFLLRIVRGACAPGHPVGLAQFRRQTPLSVKQVIRATSPFHTTFSAAKGYIDWSSVVAYTLEDFDAGQAGHQPLQLANLLLEAVWFYTFEQGLAQAAFDAVERLARLMPVLKPEQQRFFRESMGGLPAELKDTFDDVPQEHRGTRKASP